MKRHLVRTLLVLAIVGLAQVSAVGAPYYLEHTFLNPTPEDYDYMGYAVAGVGGHVLLGAPYDNTGADAAGSAYLFDGTTGALRLTVSNPAPGAADLFGRSVAGLGTNLIVGAPFDDGGESNSGSAYLLDGTTGTLLQTFVKPVPGANERLGTAMAALGGNVLVSAPGEIATGGSVYLFDPATGAIVRTLANPSPATGDGFGSSIAVLGSNVIVGAPGDDGAATNGGVAYLFDGATGALLLTFAHPVPDFGDEFGWCVAAVGGNVLIGAPYAPGGGAAYLFDGTTGDLLHTLLSPSPSNNASFGGSVGAVGTAALVGEPGNDTGGANTGAVYLFDGASGALITPIFNPDPADFDTFGSAVAGVGNKVLVGMYNDDTGAENTGAAFLYSSQVVPEPATLTLLALGGIGLLARRRRRA